MSRYLCLVLFTAHSWQDGVVAFTQHEFMVARQGSVGHRQSGSSLTMTSRKLFSTTVLEKKRPPSKSRQLTIPSKRKDETTYNKLTNMKSLPQILDDREQTAPKKTLTDNDVNASEMPFLILGLCWGVAFLSALDRVAMSVALLPMATEMGFSDSVMGLVSSLFSVGYGIFIIPAGFLLAETSPRLVMATGIGIWSLATIATPLTASIAGSIFPLLAARAMVGAAESVLLPSLQKFVANWVPSQKVSGAMAFIYSGLQMGTVGAYLMSPSVMELTEGWRGLFFVYGSIGLLYLVPWLTLAQDRPDQEVLPEPTSSRIRLPSLKRVEEETGTFSDAVKSIQSAPIKEMFASRGVQGIILAHAANNWGLYNSLAWTPTFYAQQYGFNVRDSAFLFILPSVAGAVGGFVAGNLADYFIQKLDANDEKGLTNIRKAFQGTALLGPAFCLSILSTHIPDQPWLAQGLLMGTVGFQAFNAAGYVSSVQEKAGEKWSGLLYSISSLPGVIVGSTGVYITGRLLDYSDHDWSQVFGLNAFIDVLGATAFLALYNSKREFD